MSDRYIPAWRLQPKRVRRLPNSTIGWLSSIAALLLFFPVFIPNGLAAPISFQIAAKEWYALALVAVLAVVALAVSFRLFASGHWPGGLVLVADLAFLGFISGSDPKSADHLFVYMLAAAVTIAWILLVARDAEDAVLEWLAYGAIAGVFVSFALMGIGERILLTCILAGINVLYYRHFPGD